MGCVNDIMAQFVNFHSLIGRVVASGKGNCHG